MQWMTNDEVELAKTVAAAWAGTYATPAMLAAAVRDFILQLRVKPVPR